MTKFALVVELVDTYALGAYIARCEGSSPSESTKIRKLKRSRKNLFILEAGYIYCRLIEITDDEYEMCIDEFGENCS